VNFDITLEPLRGEMNRDGAIITVEHDVYQIFVGGATGSEEAFKQVRAGRSREMIGFVGKQPGAPINFLKVVLAFGDNSAKMFTMMIRQALVAKAKERITAAREAASEAAEMVEEAKALLAEQRELQMEEVDALEAKQLAELAMQEAFDEISVAGGLMDAEEATDRPASAPDRSVVNSILAEAASPQRSSGDDAVGDMADLQNL
jgi:hypothetical protein